MTDSFAAKYERLYPSVVRSCWLICRDLARAEELAQDAFVRAYRRWDRLERLGYAEAWVHRVAMNLTLSALRRRTRGRELEAEANTWGSHLTPADEPDGWLTDTLARLPKRQREAVFLRVVADLPEDEVAALMGCSTGSVKQHKKRGLDRLRTLITESEEAHDGPHRTQARTAEG